MDALVEADRCLQLAGDLTVQHDVVVEERLLDEQQIKIVEHLKATPVGHGVGRVGIDLEKDIWEATTDLPGHFVVEPRPYLHFQATEAERDRLLGQIERLGYGFAAD